MSMPTNDEAKAIIDGVADFPFETQLYVVREHLLKRSLRVIYLPAVEAWVKANTAALNDLYRKQLDARNR